MLVGIGRPRNSIFTQQVDFSAKFSHAFGQALDFQDWVDEHGEYAQSKLKGISSRKGLLVMGQRSVISDRQKAKLHRFNSNSTSIRVATYDDLLEDVKASLQNLLGSEASVETETQM
ncbi:MAG: Shedu anti-phage system protein SduA domain-containing protein [Alphaproteobacteria bacterium]